MNSNAVVSTDEMEADLEYFRAKLARYKDPTSPEASKTAAQLAMLEDAVAIYRLRNPRTYEDEKNV